MFHGGECFLCVQPPTSTVLWENWGSWQPMEAKGRHPGSLCTSGWQGHQLHATGLETRPGEGQVTGASSPAALPSVLDLSPLCPQDPSALARGPEWLWLWMTGCGKNEKISKWKSSLQLSSAFTWEGTQIQVLVSENYGKRHLSLNKNYDKPKVY